MKKSIYSLVLSDDIIAEIDCMAYQLHTSRSNLINQILAEHLSCVTPEMRMQAVFSHMEQMMQQFRILEQTSDRMLSLQSQLDYKYKPTVQYFVKLYPMLKDEKVGVLRVVLRTQNVSLIRSLDQFFRLWMQWEKEYIPCTSGTVYELSAGKLERSLQNPCEDETEFAELIGEYVIRFDKYLKAWFAGASDPVDTAEKLEISFFTGAYYKKYLIRRNFYECTEVYSKINGSHSDGAEYRPFCTEYEH